MYAVVGPTASGKSELAMALAQRVEGIILSVDSMQVYRRMDIGTAKPTTSARQLVHHEMLDLVEPSEEFSVAEFQRIARAVIEDSERPVVVAGGSGLHFRAVVDPLTFEPSDPAVRHELELLEPDEMKRRLLAADPEAGQHLDIDNPRRVVRALEIHQLTGLTPAERARDPQRRMVERYEPLHAFRAVGVDPGETVDVRIADRITAMERAGLLHEVSSLRHQLGRTASQAVGYKELLPVVDGELPLEDGLEEVRRVTRALVKRQRTFFRADPRIAWLPWDDASERRLDHALAVLELA